MSSIRAATTLAVASGAPASLYQSCNDPSSSDEKKCAQYFQTIFDASNIAGCQSIDGGKCGLLASAANLDWIHPNWNSNTDFVGSHPQSSGEPVKQDTNKYCDDQLGNTGNSKLAYGSMSFLNKALASAAKTDGKSTILTFSDSGEHLKSQGFAYLINHEAAGEAFEVPAFVSRDAQSNWRCYQMGLSASLLTTGGKQHQETGYKYVKYADIMCPTCGEDCGGKNHFSFDELLQNNAHSDPHYSAHVKDDTSNDFNCQAVIDSSGSFQAAFATDSNPDKTCYKPQWKDGQADSCSDAPQDGRFLTAVGQYKDCDSCFNSLCAWQADGEGKTVTGKTLNQGVQLSEQLIKNLCSGRSLDDCVNQFLYTEIFSKYSDNYADHSKGWDNHIAAVAIKSDMWTKAGNGDQKSKDYICAITKHRDDIKKHISTATGRSGYVLPLVVFDFQGADQGEVFSADDVEATAQSYCGGSSDIWTKHSGLNCYHKADQQHDITSVEDCKKRCQEAGLNADGTKKCGYITMSTDGTQCFFNKNQDEHCTGTDCCDNFTENPTDPQNLAIDDKEFDTYIPDDDWFGACVDQDHDCASQIGQCETDHTVKIRCQQTCQAWCPAAGHTESSANNTTSLSVTRANTRREASRKASHRQSHRSASRRHSSRQRRHSSRQRNSRKSRNSRHSRRNSKRARSAHRQQRRSERH